MPTLEHERTTTTRAANELEAGQGRPGGLIVADHRGLFELELGTWTRRRLCARPASFPREDTQGQIFFVDYEELSLWVRRPGGETERVIELPNAVDSQRGCQISRQDSPDGYQLDLNSDEDFELSADGRFACFRLMDRNLNMADVHVEVGVDLARGEIRSQILWPFTNDEVCPVPETPPPSVCQSFASHGRWEEADSSGTRADFAYRFDENSGCVLGRGGQRGPCYLVTYEDGEMDTLLAESTSFSGRWVVLTTPPSVADYIYRDAYLFDRKRGELFAVVEGPWGEPVRPASAESMMKGSFDTHTLIGESSIWWVGQREILVLGGLVVEAGKWVVRAGDVAP